MKNPGIKLLLCLICSALIVVALFAISRKKTHTDNGFYRLFPPHPVTQAGVIDLKYNSYYFAGVDSLRVFLGNSINPAHILEIKPENLNDTLHYRIKADRLKYKSVRIQVAPPYFYVTDGSMPFIYRGNITCWVATPYIQNIYFTDAIPISGQSLALLGVNRHMEKTFYKTIKGRSIPKVYPDLLEPQDGEGIFSTDGDLHYDKKTKRLTYVYLYRNQFLLMDTDFNLLHKGNTIDTISKAKIKIGKINSKNTITTSAPPLKVNKKSYVSGNYLYVHSNIMARNENIGTFKNSSVIDIYYLENGEYLFSFYIPPYKENTLKEFTVINNDILLVRYARNIVAYKLNIVLHSQNDGAE